MAGPHAYAPVGESPIPSISDSRGSAAPGPGGRWADQPLFRTRLVLLVVLVIFGAFQQTARGEDRLARRARIRNQLDQVLDVQDAWFDSARHGPAWRHWLGAEALREEIDLDSPGSADRLFDILERYESDIPGLDRNELRDVRRALREYLSTLPDPTIGELMAMIDTAASDTASDVRRMAQMSRSVLSAELDAVDAHLGGGTAHGPTWQQYLETSALAAELAKGESADLARLESILSRYQTGHRGLETARVRSVERCLAMYCRRLRAAHLDEPSEQLAETIQRLSASLERYEARGRQRHLKEIAQCIEWLDRHGLVPHIVRAVRRRLARPNLFAQVAGDVLFAPYQQQIDEEFAIRDTMSGAQVRGTGRLVGAVSFELVANPDRAAIAMLFAGSMRSATTGHSGPIGFRSTGRTELTAEKLLLAGPDAVSSQPARARADTQISVGSVWSSFRGPVLDRVARKVGTKRIYSARPGNQQLVSRKARRNLESRFDAQADELVESFNETFVDTIRVPLTEQHVYPADLRLSTTHEHLRLQATQAESGQLAALTPPPPLDNRAAMALAVHESLVNNTTNTALAGRTIASYEMAQVLESIVGSIPREFDNVDGVPWELTVADADPLEVRFAGNKLRMIIRCQRVSAGAEQYDIPFSVAAVYEPSLEGEAIVFRRPDDLELALSVPGARQPTEDELTDSQRQLARRFEMMFQRELRFTASQLPFDMPPGLEMAPGELELSGGWLVAAFNLKETAGAPIAAQASR